MQAKLNNTVPQIIALYWVIKIAATTLGETGADLFSMTLNIGYDLTILLFLSLFLTALLLKVKQAQYTPLLYWITFTTSAIAGTAISDYIDRTLGFGYLYGSILLVGLLLLILAFWYVKEKTLSVELITKPSVEIYYWMAFLVANTLGTAVGDYIADDLQLGFAAGAAIIASLLVICALLHYLTKVSGLLLFWIAFVLTRPFGATFGDFLTKTHEHGGVGVGTVGASIFFLVVLAISLAFEYKRYNKLANR